MRRVEPEDALYRTFLRAKLEMAEEDVRAGRLVSHEEVEAETARWFAEEEHADYTEAWCEEIERRTLELDEGVVEPVSWEEVRERVFGRPPDKSG